MFRYAKVVEALLNLFLKIAEHNQIWLPIIILIFYEKPCSRNLAKTLPSINDVLQYLYYKFCE